MWFDLVLFTVLGTVGILLFVLWTATDHAAAANNFNLLWALPTNLVVIGVFAKKARPALRKYFLGVALLTTLLLAVWTFLPQQMNVFLLPFVGTIALRAYILSRWLV